KEGLQEGIEKGLQQGLQKGLQQGKIEGLKESIYDILEIKFAEPGLKLYEKVDKLDSLETLQKIRIALKKAKTLDEAEKAILLSLEK
ncbi:MAG: hypothetical protein D6814_04895, partial [Calditrichaeota bacterium]